MRFALLPAVLGTALLGLGLTAAATRAQAQDYPAKNITVLCGFAAGGGGDLLCRYFAQKLEAVAGQSTVVENKVGALGSIAAQAAARAKPDGYTILVSPGSSTHSAHPYQFRQPLYDPIKDFTLITTVAQLPFILVVNPEKTPVNSVAELTEFLKKKGRSKTGGSTVSAKIASETYKLQAGVDAINVNYKSAQVAVTDLIAGELDFAFVDAGLATGQMKSGKIKGLAVTSPERFAALPELPTMAEAGLEGFDVTPWWGVFGPAAMPEPVVAKLRGWLDGIVRTEETKAFLHNAGIAPMPAGDRDLQDFQVKQLEKWGKLYQQAQVEPQ